VKQEGDVIQSGERNAKNQATGGDDFDGKGHGGGSGGDGQVVGRRFFLKDNGNENGVIGGCLMLGGALPNVSGDALLHDGNTATANAGSLAGGLVEVEDKFGGKTSPIGLG